MLYIFGTNGIEVSPDYALLAKAVLCVEETARALDPGFDIEEVARPFLQQLEKELMDPGSIARQTIYPFFSVLRTMQQVPGSLQRILQRVEEEDSVDKHAPCRTEQLEETFNASMNRLTVGIIVGL